MSLHRGWKSAGRADAGRRCGIACLGFLVLLATPLAPAMAHDGPHLWDVVPLWQIVLVVLMVGIGIALREWLRRRRERSRGIADDA